MKFKKGDEIIITVGKDAGSKGKIERMLIKKNKVIVAGLNLYKKHVKPQGEGKKGGIIDIARPIPISNISPFCPKCQKPTRFGYRLEGADKIRICRKCDQAL